MAAVVITPIFAKIHDVSYQQIKILMEFLVTSFPDIRECLVFSLEVDNVVSYLISFGILHEKTFTISYQLIKPEKDSKLYTLQVFYSCQNREVDLYHAVTAVHLCDFQRMVSQSREAISGIDSIESYSVQRSRS